jgi:glycerate 2-kinase
LTPASGAALQSKDRIVKIVLSPDSFKDCLPATAVCAALETGVRRAVPDAEIVRLPLADGGEGTLDALEAAGRLDRTRVTVTGPLGTVVESGYGTLEDGKTAIVEMALASGLQLVPPGLRNPLRTTSTGTGQLIRHGLDAGFRDIVIAAGGSATSDCGAGCLQALGIRFLDRSGREIPRPMTGADMGAVADVDALGLHPAVRGSRFRVATDVDNPLLGPAGAVAAYAAQKGASGRDLDILEEGTASLIGVIEEAVGLALADLPGAGAAGGIYAGLAAFAAAERVSGAEWMLEACGFHKAVAGADLVITGEGRLDGQTESGKLAAVVAAACRSAGVPVIAVAGRVDLDPERIAALGFQSAVAASDGSMPLEAAIRNAPALIADAASMAVLRFSGKAITVQGSKR